LKDRDDEIADDEIADAEITQKIIEDLFNCVYEVNESLYSIECFNIDSEGREILLTNDELLASKEGVTIFLLAKVLAKIKMRWLATDKCYKDIDQGSLFIEQNRKCLLMDMRWVSFVLEELTKRMDWYAKESEEFGAIEKKYMKGDGEIKKLVLQNIAECKLREEAAAQQAKG